MRCYIMGCDKDATHSVLNLAEGALHSGIRYAYCEEHADYKIDVGDGQFVNKLALVYMSEEDRSAVRHV